MGRKHKKEPWLNKDTGVVHQALLRAQGLTPVAAAKPVMDPAVAAMIRAATIDVRLAPVDLDDLTKPLTWILAADGVYRARQTAIGMVVTRTAKVTLPGLGEQTEGWYGVPFPRLPWILLNRIVAFFRAVNAIRQTESLIRVYYHSVTGLWSLHVPVQVVGPADVLVAADVVTPEGLGEWVAEFHSHPGTSSVFSGTDDAHERAERIFGCVASVNAGAIPNFHLRLGTGFEFLEIALEDVVEQPENVMISVPVAICLKGGVMPKLDPFTPEPIPSEWLDAVSESRQVVYSGYQGGGGTWAGFGGSPMIQQDRRIAERDRSKYIGLSDQEAEDLYCTLTTPEIESHGRGCLIPYASCALCRVILKARRAEGTGEPVIWNGHGWQS